MSRTNSSVKNLIVAFAGQVLGILISLVSRIIFLSFLNEEYLGLNGLFTNILTIFSPSPNSPQSPMPIHLHTSSLSSKISQMKIKTYERH